MDYTVHGILQTRILEKGKATHSSIYKIMGNANENKVVKKTQHDLDPFLQSVFKMLISSLTPTWVMLEDFSGVPG